MKFGSRSHAAGIAAGLFVLAQTTAFAQNFALRPQAVVITKTDTFLPGPVQMVAAANADEVFVHPQGRYALVIQKEAALPPAPMMGKDTTGAVALLLYDARLHKTRTLWQRRADGRAHGLAQVEWLPGTDCAVVVTVDVPAPTVGVVPAGGNKGDGAEAEVAETSSLLFFDFGKSLAPRVLATTPNGFTVDVSPTKPSFVVREDEKVRMGSAPRATLSPFLQVPSNTFFMVPLWNTEGTSIFVPERIITKAAPDAKPEAILKWYEWDGKAPNANALNARPPKAMLAQTTPPPTLSIALRTTTFSLQMPLAKTPTPKAKIPSKTGAPISPMPPTTVLHPLYLEAVEPFPTAANSYRAALIAPDAEKSYLLADQSAVLYESGGALYAVPLVKLNSAEYAQVQKAQAIQNAKQVGLGILMYTQDYDEEFPLQSRFADGINPYLKNDAAVQSFTYLGPDGGLLSSVASPATTIMVVYRRARRSRRRLRGRAR